MDGIRRLCLAALGCAAWPAMAAAPPPVRLAATWRDARTYHAGVLGPKGNQLHVAREIELPTRAHGLLQQPDGRVIVVARRPGDWLLRWDPASGRTEWWWADGTSSLNGHVRASLDGQRLYFTETDPATGQGQIVVRDAATLRLLDTWATHGIDPHDLCVDADSLWVANGGIATRPESGRAKLDLARMDSSLVRLDARTGALVGQWRLADRRLSLRHLALAGAGRDRRLAIALQAEHDDPLERAAAPVLAIFDGSGVSANESPTPLAGYGGDVASTRSGFAVSCPRVDAVALFDTDGSWKGSLPLAAACALGVAGDALWIGGRHGALRSVHTSHHPFASDLELDNHWLPLR